MSEKNKELIKKINAAFIKGKVERVAGYIDRNIRWNIVGMPQIKGKDDFIKTKEMMLRESFPNIKIKNIVAEGDFVVVESADIDESDTDKEIKSGKPFTPSYCDIYLIRNGKIYELTTYIVDVSVNN